MKNASNILFIFLLLLTTTQLFSQSKDRTIYVKGNARVVVRPDIGVLNIRVSELRPTMQLAVDALAEMTDGYTQKLEALGFDKEEIKTTSFSVSKNRIYQNNQYRDSGYVASQNVRLEFEYKGDILSDILGKFSESELELNFSFSFKLSEELKKEVQKQIILDAVEDGQTKANILAEASGQTIVELKSINYSGWNGGNSGMERVTAQRQYAAQVMASGGPAGSFNFSPEDIVFRDSVSLTFLIE